MIYASHRLFCRIDEMPFAEREAVRSRTQERLGLLQAAPLPILDEATQTITRSLDIPICILGIMYPEYLHIKAAVGLSQLGLMNDLATQRQIPRLEAFCSYVVDSQQVFAIADTLSHPAFASSVLAQQYGLRAYLGVPLMTATGVCVGTLAVCHLQPYEFAPRDVEFLQMTARWCMSELERLGGQTARDRQLDEPGQRDKQTIAQKLRINLLGQLAQELRTPLTSVMGMTSVLGQEIYGPLTLKQREYLNIIRDSGDYLLSLVTEILNLAHLTDDARDLNLASVDIEMLCQQAISTLNQVAQRREQQIHLSVEPGNRVWLLDKPLMHQMIYHLVFNVLQSSTAGSIVRLHVSRKQSQLNLAVWVSHPWLGDGLSYAETVPANLVPVTPEAWEDDLEPTDVAAFRLPNEAVDDVSWEAPAPVDAAVEHALDPNDPRILGILLCRQLAEMHGGNLTVQNGLNAGYRYVISLPQMRR